MKAALILSLFFLFAPSAHPQGLPDSPEPKAVPSQPGPAGYTGKSKPAIEGKFWTKSNKWEFGAMSFLALGDAGQTCWFLAHGAREGHLTQSCPADTALIAGFVGAAASAAWLLHRTHHHKLEKIPMLYQAVATGVGIIGSSLTPAFKPKAKPPLQRLP